MTKLSPSTDIRRDLVALLPRLRRFALTLSASAQDADNLVREVAARAIQKSHHWKGEGRLESWLFSIMRSAFTEDQKKRRRNDPEAAAVGSESHSLPQIVLSLPEGLASAFLLADVEGFSYSESAAILNIHPDLFATRLCAARLSLAATGSETSERRA